MNVPQTQYSLTRAADIAGIIAVQQQAAEQTTRQQALAAQREADHAAASIAQGEGAAESDAVGDRKARPEEPRQERGRPSRTGLAEEGELKDAPNPGPLGHRLDIIA